MGRDLGLPPADGDVGGRVLQRDQGRLRQRILYRTGVTVNADGTAAFSIASWDAAAIHVGAKVSGPSTVTVNFNVNATTYWGQNVYVVGNIPELGGWNTNQAVALSAAGYPIWSGSVNLPASTWVEYKYIRKDGGNVVWKCCGNRTLTTPSSGSTTRNDTWP